MSSLSEVLRSRATARGLAPKVIEVADSAARLALTNADVNAGDIVVEVGAPAVLGTMIVSGAGTSEVDGTYTEAGVSNGSRFFVKTGIIDPSISAISSEPGQWAIYDSGGDAAYLDDNYSPASVLPSDPSLAWIANAGVAPSPTVTTGITPVDAIPGGKTYLVKDTAELNNEAGWETIGYKSPIIIRVGFLGDDGDTSFTLSAGVWTKVIFDDIVSGEEYIDLANGLITPPKGYGVVSIYGDVHQHASQYFRCLAAVWANGNEYDPQSARLFDHVVFPSSVVSGVGNGLEASAMCYSEDGTTTFEMRMWRGNTGALKKYYNSGTRMIVLWFPE